jgi:hypothetical protein
MRQGVVVVDTHAPSEMTGLLDPRRGEWLDAPRRAGDVIG